MIDCTYCHITANIFTLPPILYKYIDAALIVSIVIRSANAFGTTVIKTAAPTHHVYLEFGTGVVAVGNMGFG